MAVVAVVAVGAFALAGGDDSASDATAATSAAIDDTVAANTTAAGTTAAGTVPATDAPSAAVPSSTTVAADTTAVPVDTAVLAIDDPTISFPVDDLVTATAAFESGCDTKGISADECQCIITGIVDQFGIPRFITVTNALAAHVNVKKDVVDLATACLASS